MVAYVVIAVLTWLGMHSAIETVLFKAQAWTGLPVRTPAELAEGTRNAYFMFVGGMAALALARFTSLKRGRGNIDAPLLVPAACAAAAIGLCLQIGYANPLHLQFWPGPEFARGFLIAAALGAFIILLPRDPVDVFTPVTPILPVLMIGTFVALRLWGHGTEAAPDTLINLGPIQPLELVKLAFVIYLAIYFGRRASKLRFQRDRVLGLDFPRKKVLLPAVGVMLLLFGAFMFVKDLGATMVLSVAFLALFYVVTRARGWVLLAIAMVVLGVYAAAHVPAITQSEKVTLRLQMWLNPWYNAIPFGDQLARARWAIAAGGTFGRGLGAAPAIALPAGHTDLVQAHLTEELGAAGMIAYILLLGVVAAQGIWLAAWNRTPERMLLAAGLAVLLVSQWLVIFGGTTGLVPLTGVVVPFLSYGKTGMIVFILLTAMLIRLAESGRARESTNELDEVRRGTMGTMAGTIAAVAVGIVVVVLEAVVWGPATTVRGCVTLLAQQPGDPYDRIVNMHDPRLQMIADQIKRGEILDRNGQKIVGTAPDGSREYPLGDAMGTLIGPEEAIVLRPVWMLERQLDPVLRGYPDLDDGPAVWMAEKEAGGEEFLFVVPSSEPREEDKKKAEEKAEGRAVRLLPLTRPDFRPLLPLMRASRETIKKVSDDVPSRTATITIDAKLQVAASDIMKKAAQKGKAAATVVLDANTGEVLARAQWPDFNPGAERVLKRLVDPDFPVKDKRFTGIYGPWPDKTGISGIFQAGSVFKVVTSLVAARAGLLGPTAGAQPVAATSPVPAGPSYCPIKAGPVHGCLHHDGQGPFFTRPGWYKPIHDHPEDPIHGNIEYIRGIALSCNVYFGQLGLDLGPDAFKKLVADGVEVGWGGSRIEPGKAGSRELAETAFGQDAALMSVSQLARVGGTVAGGGIYRKCPQSMQKGVPCEQRPIVTDPTQLTTILAGLQAVATQGTARGLQMPAGLRLYGKTGTADMIGLKDEIPFGVKFNEWGSPNSWFLGIGETTEVPTCQVRGPQRIVVAVVVPRGGLGARTAGPAAMEVMAAVQQLGYLPKPKGPAAPAPGQAAASGAPAATAPPARRAGATAP
jgi:cell division protein FtsW (lipid II flippase)/cell division protein FtsI/penicillin-binding protein 2